VALLVSQEIVIGVRGIGIIVMELVTFAM
jgi:hypothetical protein